MRSVVDPVMGVPVTKPFGLAALTEPEIEVATDEGGA
jgi:hypothetical protein